MCTGEETPSFEELQAIMVRRGLEAQRKMQVTAVAEPQVCHCQPLSPPSRLPACVPVYTCVYLCIPLYSCPSPASSDCDLRHDCTIAALRTSSTYLHAPTTVSVALILFLSRPLGLGGRRRPRMVRQRIQGQHRDAPRQSRRHGAGVARPASAAPEV